MSLDHLALVARVACVPGPHRTVVLEKIVLGRLPYPWHGVDSRLKHFPSLPVRKVDLLVLTLHPEG